MTAFQKVIKYLAIVIAVILLVGIIVGVLGATALKDKHAPAGESAVYDDIKTFAVAGDITVLDVEINAADFKIKYGDSFAVESNLKRLTVDDKGGVLTIKDGGKMPGATYSDAVLTVYIPADTVFEKLSLETGACRFTADSLAANVVKLRFGAGEVSINELTAAFSADIEGGAGQLTVSGGALNEADVEMGAGQLNLTAVLTGECDFDLGVGESNITVLGRRADYELEIEKGLGGITVDGVSVTNVDDDRNCLNSIDLSGGVGAINLNFTQP